MASTQLNKTIGYALNWQQNQGIKAAKLQVGIPQINWYFQELESYHLCKGEVEVVTDKAITQRLTKNAQSFTKRGV